MSPTRMSSRPTSRPTSLLWFKLAPSAVLLCKSQPFPLLSFILPNNKSSAFLICDRIGRIWATRVLATIWALGIAIFMISGVYGKLGGIYAGRFIGGLGVGMTPVVGPIYLAEIAPAAIRGLCTCFFTGAVYIGIVLAYFANYGASLHISDSSHNQWLVPTSLHIMFAGIAFILTFFQFESPRYLMKQGKVEQATMVLAKIRKQDPSSEYIVHHINEIQVALDAELEATQGVGWTGKVKEMFLNKSNLYRLYLASMVQFLSQWSGAGSITLYAPDLFALIGISGSSEGLLVTAIFGIVKLIAAITCALFLVDVIGRKRALLTGITLQTLSMIYVAGFLTAVPELGVVDDFVLPAHQKAASRGAIAMIYVSGFGWALGWNSMQYLLTAELFPLRIRALATSWSMTLHFANQVRFHPPSFPTTTNANAVSSTETPALSPTCCFPFTMAASLPRAPSGASPPSPSSVASGCGSPCPRPRVAHWRAWIVSSIFHGTALVSTETGMPTSRMLSTMRRRGLPRRSTARPLRSRRAPLVRLFKVA